MGRVSRSRAYTSTPSLYRHVQHQRGAPYNGNGASCTASQRQRGAEVNKIKTRIYQNSMVFPVQFHLVKYNC